MAECGQYHGQRINSLRVIPRPVPTPKTASESSFLSSGGLPATPRVLSPLACHHATIYTEPYGSVSPKPLRRLVRRSLGPHPTRRSGAARPCGRFDLGARRAVSDDPDGD